MDNEQIKRFALFLFKENLNKSKQLDEMVVRLDEMRAERPYRKGMRYNKDCVGTPIIHKSDYTMLPKGSVVISSSYRKIRNIVSYIEEHHFEVLKVKHADGRIESMFLPMKDDVRADIYNELSKALNYLKTFWNQIFAYRNDGEYSIYNLPAERALRPVTVQRKNSLFFGSVKGIQNSAIYNTFIETCKQVGVSFRDYFCRLLRELKKGRTDYENLLPMTICK